MADYSGYKIKRTHSLTPLTSVHEAEAPNGGPGRFALKVFHPPASTNIRRAYAIEGWLLAAERQQQSAKKDGTVLEVLAFGRCPEGAFMVLPWQEHFLEPWIKTLGQKGNTLRALAECLLNTIEKWEAQTGGPHGNLKAANVFLDRMGPLVGMSAKLSDPAYLPGTKIEERRQADLAAVGVMLATIVRRRAPGAWPIEDAPEWKALGNAGKGWLDFCNYLLNPQPAEGELTLAKARVRLKKVPKDANPVRTAGLSLAAVLVLGAVSVLGFARFGNYNSMPDRLQRLAVTLKNPSVPKEVPAAWAYLCGAWDSWLVDLQSNASRLLRTPELLEQNDDLRRTLAEFVRRAESLRPEVLVPQAAGERRLGVLGNNPPEEVFNELLIGSTVEKVNDAGQFIGDLSKALEEWPRWEQLRELRKLMEERGYTRAAGSLASKLPPARGSAEYGKLNVGRTLKFFNDLSLDNTGALPLASRWSEISHLSTDMKASKDRVQVAMPDIILRRLEDKSSLSDFADSLVSPLGEMKERRGRFTDKQVVRERFLVESPLQQETAEVTADDFKRWDEELVAFTLLPDAENPSKAPALDTKSAQMTKDSVDLEPETPEGEPGQPATLNSDIFKRELTGLTANLQALRTRPNVVRRDLPKVTEETTTLTGVFQVLADRLAYTLVLLKPDTWLAKMRQPYGIYAETKQRWEAWKQKIAAVTPAQLEGVGNRPAFLKLRKDGRTLREWIDGVEGPEGFGALKMPDLAAGTATQATSDSLKTLELALREQAVKDVAKEVRWVDALPPEGKWDRGGAAVRAPWEAHSEWLGKVRDFAVNLDQLGENLASGLEWKEGVNETTILLRGQRGVNELTGKPGQWYAEAQELDRLNGASDRAVLQAAAAAPGGGLSRKLMAWRGLGQLANWPGNPADFDFDQKVVVVVRQVVGLNVKDETRRTKLLEEMVKGTRERFNRAALFAAREEVQLTDMYSRMQGAGIKEADLIPKVAYNLELWRMRRVDQNEKNMNVLGARRDAFVAKVRAIDGGSIAAQPGVETLLKELADIELKEDPNRKKTPSPATVGGWEEKLTNQGMGMIATWKGGGRTVQLEFSIVMTQPAQPDDAPPFYLAHRVISVGEFLDLMAARPEAEVVKAALPDWARLPNATKPYDRPMAWRPRGDFKGLELNSDWIYAKTSPVLGLLTDTDARASSPGLEQAATEKPALNSPLQQITPTAAKLFAEKMLGARLPTTKEWQTLLKATTVNTTGAHFRGPNFQKLFDFIKDYHAGGQTWDWRPSDGVFLPKDYKDEGRASANTDESRLWFRPVDDGPKSGNFINLAGNVSIFLAMENSNDIYVAGGSALSPPNVDFMQPQKVTTSTRIGARAGSDPYTDVGIRPAFDAPPGFKERFKFFGLVQGQKYLTL